MFRKFVWGALAAFSLASVATAADLPVKAAPAGFDWTGFYIGGHVGRVDGRMVNPAATAGLESGFLGGLQAGYNWQFSRNWVLGIETDVSSVDTGFNFGVGVTSDMDYVGTVRARVGLAQNNWLFYGTAGVAYGRNEIVFVTPRVRTHMGVAVGGGVEWAFRRNWSLKVEYLHIDFDEENYMLANPISFELDTVRLGVNYRF